MSMVERVEVDGVLALEMLTPSSEPSEQVRGGLRIAVITCAVLEMEVNHYAQGIDHVVHIELLEQGLHNEPPKLREQLQAAIDRVELANPDAEAIVLGYGLCSRGSEGVRTSRCRLVMARAHDCITLLLGSKERYARYVAAHPGTYWYSPGWNKHHTPPGKERHDRLLEQYVQAYGEDNAAYLMQMEQSWFTSYDRATYVDLTIGATSADIAFTRECADWLKWEFDHQRGDATLLRDLLAGRWDDERFIICEPGQAFTMACDHRVVRREDEPITDRSTG
jgi:hypothetical protein